MMFSLEALMKANQPASKREDGSDEASSQLWEMQASTPLFGTAYDQALLTTPLKMEPAQSMDSMTLPSQTPNGRRWWPFVLAATAGLALAGAGIWVFGASSGASAGRAAAPSSEQAALVAEPLAEPPAAPATGESTNPATSPEVPGAGGPTAVAAATEPPAGEPADGKPAPGEPTASDSATTAAKDGASAAGVGEAARARDNAASSTKPDGEKAAKDRTIKKPVARVEKPTATPTLGAAVFAFDKAAAKAALSMAADAASRCGAGGEPGKGKIQVTFAPTGKVSDAQLVDGPFAGTTAGKCALSHFKAAKVPAFSGAPVTVAKSFRVD
jgi:hypothetical protein